MKGSGGSADSERPVVPLLQQAELFAVGASGEVA